MKNLFLTNRFFILFALIIALFMISFLQEFLFPVAQTVLVMAIALVAIDIYQLFNASVRIKVRRRLPKVFSLGDPNKVKIELHNQSTQHLIE